MVDPEAVQDKGLQEGAIGLVGATVIGLASTAPAYSLAATIGFVVAAVGVQAPAYMLVAFVPMLFVAYSYREFNKVIPDCGTSFTWVTKAFGPRPGWMAGWAVAVSGSIFIGSAAQVVGQYIFEIFGSDLATNKWAVAVVGCVFILFMAWIAYRGMQVAAEVQMGLVALQYAALALLVFTGFQAVTSGEAAMTPQWSWMNPFDQPLEAGVQGFLLCVFLYWGWDAVLAVNEETKDPEKTPGRAALIATVVLLLGYVLVTMSLLAFAGDGDTGIGLTNPDNADNVFASVAPTLIGDWGTVFILVVIVVSTAASAQTTILPTARGTLAMAIYKAAPAKFGDVNPKYHTPGFSTFMTSAVGLTFFIVVSAVSENALEDTIEAIGLAIAFYYSLTAFACVWYFRKQAFKHVKNFFPMFFMPLVGGLALAFAFLYSAREMINPDYGLTVLFGIGGVFVIGIGSLLLGVVLMIVWNIIAPPFFRGETLTTDTPVLVPDE